MTVSGELCCVALPFCCVVVVVVLPFSASLEVIVHTHIHVYRVSWFGLCCNGCGVIQTKIGFGGKIWNSLDMYDTDCGPSVSTYMYVSMTDSFNSYK